MKDCKVFILAAGSGERWQNHLNRPKQLAVIQGETIIERTVRLLHQFEIFDICVVTKDKAIFINSCDLFAPPKSRWISETILSTNRLWSSRNIFLLGDVYYSIQAMTNILNNDTPIAVFGRPHPSRYTNCNHGEIFALCFSIQNSQKILNALVAAINFAKKGAWGNLWDVYDSLAGFSFYSGKIDKNIFHKIDDITEDIDWPKDYEILKTKLSYLNSSNLLSKWYELLKINLKIPYHYMARTLGQSNYRR